MAMKFSAQAGRRGEAQMEKQRESKRGIRCPDHLEGLTACGLLSSRQAGHFSLKEGTCPNALMIANTRDYSSFFLKNMSLCFPFQIPHSRSDPVLCIFH